MAFDKEEVKQLKDLFNDQEKKINSNTDKKIEELAQITAKGFLAVDERFKSVDGKFRSVDKKFDSIDKRFDRLEERVENGFLNVNAQLDVLEREVREIRNKLSIGISKEQFFELDERLTIIEEKLGIHY